VGRARANSAASISNITEGNGRIRTLANSQIKFVDSAMDVGISFSHFNGEDPTRACNGLQVKAFFVILTLGVA
jgi:hypothetical protein